MSAIQQGKKGIDGFFFNLFGFLRRKTDFFQMEDKCMELIKKHYQDQHALYKEDELRKAAILKKKEEEKLKQKKLEEEARNEYLKEKE